MKPVSNEVVERQLGWRYATKLFDSAKKIPDSDWQTLEKALVLTPSSFGLQGIEERMRHFGGTVNIDSEPGSGTVIRVTVPLSKPHAVSVMETIELQHNLF